VDFFNPDKWKSSKSPYHGWAWEDGALFLKALLELIRYRPKMVDVGGIVDVRDFRAMTPEERMIATGGQIRYAWKIGADLFRNPDAVEIRTTVLPHTGSRTHAYHAGFHYLIGHAARLTPTGARVHFTLDLQNQYEGLARQNYNKMVGEKMDGWEKLGGLHYESKAHHPGLQAADLYAYIVNAMATTGGKVPFDKLVAAATLVGRRRRSLPMLNAKVWAEQRKAAEALLVDAMVENFRAANPGRFDEEGRPLDRGADGND
jgi:hypothetical protein